jgi:hypothetical protein
MSHRLHDRHPWRETAPRARRLAQLPSAFETHPALDALASDFAYRVTRALAILTEDVEAWQRAEPRTSRLV